MAAKKILLLISSDRLAYPLTRYLTDEGKRYGWKVRVGCMFDPHLATRMREEQFADAAEFFDITKIQEWDPAIKKADLVIGIMTDSLLLQVADSCIRYGKTLISPNRLNRQMALKKIQAVDRNVLLMMDCGFSPGLDHITAKKAIDNIRAKGGKITSFKTCSGSFASSGSVQNPLGFSLTEPMGELLAWGRHNNRHLLDGHLQQIPYDRLFERSQPIDVMEVDQAMLLPEGDSLYYRRIYGLEDAHTVVKGKLIGEAFNRIWKIFVRLGLTDTTSRIDFAGEPSFYNLLDALLPYSPSATIEERLHEYTGADEPDINALKWLGLFDTTWIDGSGETTPAIVLQYLMEQKLFPKPDDGDQLVMRHQLAYDLREERFGFSGTLIFQGDNFRESALAKVSGCICGAVARSVLTGSLNLKGIHIPIAPEIYDPVIDELEDKGIAFNVTESRTQIRIEVSS